MIQLLSELREPPVVGRRYMVPVVEYPYIGKVDLWPTLGPLHHDKGDVGFEPVHLHLDVRFLSGKQADFIRRKGWRTSVEGMAATAPLNTSHAPPPGKPHLAALRCRVSSWVYSPPGRAPWLDKFDARYGKVADPIRIKGGRLLCPHRKVDLSSFPPDGDGIVTCPLHGLRVKCGEATPQRSMGNCRGRRDGGI